MMLLKELAPPEALGKNCRVVITGREEVLLEGHTGLFSYETSCVRLRTKRGIWVVTGESLTIDHFGNQDALIRGKIDAVTMHGEEA